MVTKGERREARGAGNIPTSDRVRVGKVLIVRQTNGKLWLQHEAGEGMQIDEARFAAVVEKFFNEQF